MRNYIWVVILFFGIIADNLCFAKVRIDGKDWEDAAQYDIYASKKRGDYLGYKWQDIKIHNIKLEKKITENFGADNYSIVIYEDINFDKIKEVRT